MQAGGNINIFQHKEIEHRSSYQELWVKMLNLSSAIQMYEFHIIPSHRIILDYAWTLPSKDACSSLDNWNNK